MPSKSSTERHLPLSVPEWKRLAGKWKASGGIKQLGSPDPVKSASKFKFEHFLGLQIIYEFPKPKSRIPNKIIQQFPSFADSDLDSLDGWDAYLREIQSFDKHGMTQSNASQKCVPPTLEAFIPVWQFQLHVLLGDEVVADLSKVSAVSPVANRTRAKMAQQNPYITPTPAASVTYPSIAKQAAKLSLENTHSNTEAENIIRSQEEEHSEEREQEGATADVDPTDGFYTPARGLDGQLIKDEQTVNVFLLTLLSAITATTVPFETRWLAERTAMVFQKQVRYVARTDGHLRNKRGPSFSLVEVKPRKRADDVAIRIQESAQMAAWIAHNSITSHDPDKSCKIFLLSQDKDELFVTFPTFSDAYGKNADMNDAKSANFLGIHEYGPFKLRKMKNVKHIRGFLHSYTLHKSRK